ncbi:M48 family metallopeptidase [Vitiosangium sp. GDMCC 1.1324]|uniref:M48 family metallopeptidase n=1 Tax=Vitiosangium sp. (strain GDMCC 1.1324) TaxID=2138576 RepID=UPI00130D4AE6|nr:M48 family metallopeptidase [Vitiosangium sp. GDMCC 1.1324]
MAHENPSFFQSTTERRLRDGLRADKGIQRGPRRTDELPGGPGAVTRRRRLLSDAFRLTRSTAPAVVDALATCQAVLGHEGPVEVFVHPEPGIRAAAVHGPPETPAIVLSSRLIEAFSEAELRFILGHELGHVALGHFLEHLGQPSEGPAPHATVLEHYLWSRAAEVSADRAGLLCARDLEAAASALFKLTSGLSSASVKSELQVHTRQVDAILSDPSARERPRDDNDTLSYFSTHAFSPPRLRALVAFSKTSTFRRIAGRYASDEGLSDEEADSVLERDLLELAPSRLEEKSDRADLVRQVLAQRELVEAPLSQRARLVQHLTLVTAPDGNVSDERFLELRRVAETLSVPAWLIDEAIRGASHPLD